MTTKVTTDESIETAFASAVEAAAEFLQAPVPAITITDPINDLQTERVMRASWRNDKGRCGFRIVYLPDAEPGALEIKRLCTFEMSLQFRHEPEMRFIRKARYLWRTYPHKRLFKDAFRAGLLERAEVNIEEAEGFLADVSESSALASKRLALASSDLGAAEDVLRDAVMFERQLHEEISVLMTRLNELSQRIDEEKKHEE